MKRGLTFIRENLVAILLIVLIIFQYNILRALDALPWAMRVPVPQCDVDKPCRVIIERLTP